MRRIQATAKGQLDQETTAAPTTADVTSTAAPTTAAVTSTAAPTTPSPTSSSPSGITSTPPDSSFGCQDIGCGLEHDGQGECVDFGGDVDFLVPDRHLRPLPGLGGGQVPEDRRGGAGGLLQVYEEDPGHSQGAASTGDHRGALVQAC